MSSSLEPLTSNEQRLKDQIRTQAACLGWRFLGFSAIIAWLLLVIRAVERMIEGWLEVKEGFVEWDPRPMIDNLLGYLLAELQEQLGRAGL